MNPNSEAEVKVNETKYTTISLKQEVENELSCLSCHLPAASKTFERIKKVDRRLCMPPNEKGGQEEKCQFFAPTPTSLLQHAFSSVAVFKSF